MKGIPLELDVSSLLQSSNLSEAARQLKLLAKNSIYFYEFSQRQFHNPKGYLQWDDFLTSLAFNLMGSDNVDPKEMDYALINSSVLLRDIYQEQPQTFPCYWLDGNLMQAFLNTDLPNVMQMKRSHAYGTIFLPQGKLRSPDGHSVNWIVFAHRIRDEASKTQFPAYGSVTQKYPEDILQIFTALGWQNTLYFSGCSLERIDPNGLPYRDKEIFVEIGRETSREISDQAERTFVDQLLSITLQCLLWLQMYQPTELVPSGVGFGNGKTPKSSLTPLSPLNPRWIGKGYQPKSSSITSQSLASSRHSPRTHWRRGHWRSQKVGAGRKHLKTIWIEPVLING